MGPGWDENTSLSFQSWVISHKPCGSLLDKFSLIMFPYNVYSIFVSCKLTNSEKLEGRENDEYKPQLALYCKTFKNTHFICKFSRSIFSNRDVFNS